MSALRSFGASGPLSPMTLTFLTLTSGESRNQKWYVTAAANATISSSTSQRFGALRDREREAG